MNRRNFYKQIVLPTLAGAAGLAVVAGVAFKVAHHSQSASTTAVATANSSGDSQDTNDVNSSGIANETHTANEVTNIPSNNTSVSNANGVGLNSAAGASSSDLGSANSTQQAPQSPGTLGEPANSPAGPTPPSWSPIESVSISATKHTVELGTPDQFVIQADDKHGKPFDLSGQHVTYRVFGPNDGSTVSSTGVFMAKNASTYQVDALVDGVQSNLITVTVQPTTHPYKVTLTSSSNLVAGSSLQSVVMVHVVDVNGHDVEGATVTFSDSNSAVVSMDGTKQTTDVNGMATVEATSAAQSESGSATITAKVTASGESASTSVVVNAKPAKIELEGNVVDQGYQSGYFLVKVEDARGNGIPGIATKPTVSGGAILGANQYAYTSDASGIVRIPVNFMNNSPIQATIDVMGTNITWSGTVNR